MTIRIETKFACIIGGMIKLQRALMILGNQDNPTPRTGLISFSFSCTQNCKTVDLIKLSGTRIYRNEETFPCHLIASHCSNDIANLMEVCIALVMLRRGPNILFITNSLAVLSLHFIQKYFRTLVAKLQFFVPFHHLPVGHALNA